jgi:hypothetical protein
MIVKSSNSKCFAKGLPRLLPNSWKLERRNIHMEAKT